MKNKSKPFSTSKVVASLLAVIIMIVAQVLSMLIGNFSVMIGLPVVIGNIITSVLYSVLTLLGLQILCKKILKLSLADCKITKPKLQPIWCVAAFVMPVLVCAVLIFMSGHWQNISWTQNRFWA